MVSVYILHRTGGVLDTFEGTRDQVLAECERRNETDDQGSTEILGQYRSASEALAALDEMQR